MLSRFERHFAVGETVEKLSMPQLNAVASTFRELGKRDGIGKIAATWMARGDDWRKLEPR